MAPPLACGPEAPQCRLLRAAADGDLPLFKRTASLLDGGKGRLRDAVEAVNVGGRAGALHLAAGHGRMAVCVFLVEELRVDVNAADESGNCEIVKALLSKGANVDALCELGTPLHMAAFWKQDGALKILLDHHADCNMVCNTVYSPLLAALSTGSLNCVKLLIKAGADVKGVGTVTPLIMAANNGLTDFYKCLLEAGADPNVRDDVGQLPIEIAAYHNRRKDVEILLPVTSRTPYVRDWSVDGIIRYVKSMPSVEDDPMYKMNPADLKLEGSKAYKRKDYATALELYSLAIHHCPADATLFSNRSLCSLKLGKGDQALMDAELCKMKRPGWAKAYYLQGSAQMLLRVPFSATHECICLLC
nr:ankyrin repeat domain-containing protein 17 isoform X2 [Aegilops tauschii subsp. strangulata]